MGAYVSLVNSHGQSIAPDFNYFVTELTAPTSCPVSTGFECSYQTNIFSGNHLNAFFSIKPRVYPLELSSSTGEADKPGDYSLTFVTNTKLPVSITLSKDQHPIIQTKKAINNYNISGSYTLSHSNDISLMIKHSSPYVSNDITLVCNNRGKDNGLIYSISMGIPKIQNLGLTLSIPFSGSPSFATIIGRKIGENNFGLMINYGNQKNIGIGISSFPSDRTMVGALIKIDSDLTSNVGIGFQRTFTLSKLCVTVDPIQSVNSIYIKNLNDQIEMICSCHYNFITQQSVFGMAFNINQYK